MNDERETHMLTGAYALGAVDDLEAARLRELLRTSPEAAAEVRSFTETAARLGAAEAVDAPPQMRAAVLAEVARTRQLPPVGRPEPAGTTRMARLVSVAAACLLVVSVGAGFTALGFRERASQAEAANQAMTQVLTDPDRQVRDADFAGGHATMVVSGDRVVVLGTDVATPPEGKAYQLWRLADGTAIPVTTLTQTGDGSYWADTTGYQQGEALAVTVEPEGGSEQPTTEPLFVADA